MLLYIIYITQCSQENICLLDLMKKRTPFSTDAILLTQTIDNINKQTYNILGVILANTI